MQRAGLCYACGVAIETEIKVRLAARAEFARKLTALGFKEKTPRTLEVNVLFDFADNRMSERGEVLRLRKYGDTWILTHKAAERRTERKVHGGADNRNPLKHKVRIETETVVEDGEAVSTMFASFGLAPVFRYEKYRSEWMGGKGHVLIDETPIGDFAELEGSPDWIDATAKALAIDESEYVTSNYISLFKKSGGDMKQGMVFNAAQPSA